MRLERNIRLGAAAIAAMLLATCVAPYAHAHRKGHGFDRSTIKYGAIILRVGLTKRATWHQGVAALAAAMTETNGPNQRFPAKITNPTYGHSSSVGLFQILDIHGPYRLRINPWWSSNWFFSQAKRQPDARQAQRRRSAAALAQAVEDSAHPSRYRAHVDDAVVLAHALGYYNRAGRLARK